ncbi:MAG: hypothetical protein HOA06_07765 [Chloroflexi bacterium]|jgi:micrococcal nuclease|nr:hypothetical protein [Chloroflexota bacterium]
MSEPFTYNALCTRVVDGDTVDVDIDLGFGIAFNNQRIRLLGIDAPETRTRDDAEKVAGLRVKKWLADRVEGKKVVVKTEVGDSKGKFGRILGTIIHDGEDLNAYMLAEGMVAIYE